MTGTTDADRREAAVQTLASWKIEGFEPDAEWLALLDRYVAGEITLAEISARVEKEYGVKTKSAA